MLFASGLFFMMYIWYEARKIRNRFVEFVKVKDSYQILDDLSHDTSVPKYATNLVFLTSANRKDEIESKIKKPSGINEKKGFMSPNSVPENFKSHAACPK